MTRFYAHYLRGDAGAPAALRAACLELKREGWGPKVWAAFVVYGGAEEGSRRAREDAAGHGGST